MLLAWFAFQFRQRVFGRRVQNQTGRFMISRTVETDRPFAFVRSLGFRWNTCLSQRDALIPELFAWFYLHAVHLCLPLSLQRLDS